MVKNSELKVNQGCNLKWKPTEERDEQFFRIKTLWNRTLEKPWKNIRELI
jgi:hypothetical protein